MTPPSVTPNLKIDVIIERLEALQTGQRDMANNISSISCNLQNFQLGYTKAHEQLVADVTQSLKRLDGIDKHMEKIDSTVQLVVINDKRLSEAEDHLEEVKVDVDTLRKNVLKLSDDMKPLIFANKIMIFIMSAVGVSVIALIWGLITHTVKLLAGP